MIELNFCVDELGRPRFTGKAQLLSNDDNLGLMAEVDVSSDKKNIGVTIITPEQDRKLLQLMGATPIKEDNKNADIYTEV